jgi:hypothetical protein
LFFYIALSCVCQREIKIEYVGREEERAVNIIQEEREHKETKQTSLQHA